MSRNQTASNASTAAISAWVSGWRLPLWWAFSGNGDDEISYVTEPAAVDHLIVTVSATGRLQPTNEVEVGSELSGILDIVTVDYNDHVTKGQLLARLDVSKLTAEALKRTYIRLVTCPSG